MSDQSATEPKTKRRHRPRNGMGVYVTDGELYEYLGLPPDTARRAIDMLDRNPRSGFPKKDSLFGDRRYLPAVQEWLDKYNRIGGHNPQEKAGPRKVA